MTAVVVSSLIAITVLIRYALIEKVLGWPFVCLAWDAEGNRRVGVGGFLMTAGLETR